jgi:serine/threonine protein kinase
MSPEIINGLNFDLPTDVFSLGIIFIEIMSRRLVDSKTFIVRKPLKPQVIHLASSAPILAYALHTLAEVAELRSVKLPPSSPTKPKSVVASLAVVHPLSSPSPSTAA